jgi:hypothetical protein
LPCWWYISWLFNFGQDNLPTTRSRTQGKDWFKLLQLCKALRCNTLPATVGGETRARCLVTTGVQSTCRTYFWAFQTMGNPYLSPLSSQTSGSIIFFLVSKILDTHSQTGI